LVFGEFEDDSGVRRRKAIDGGMLLEASVFIELCGAVNYYI
jgi:hypothetical protein